jgi:hypothetical protein
MGNQIKRCPTKGQKDSSPIEEKEGGKEGRTPKNTKRKKEIAPFLPP